MKELVLAIDAGTTHSGVVLTLLEDGNPPEVLEMFQDMKNEDLRYYSIKVHHIYGTRADRIFIEDIVSYGMEIGQTTMDTIKWNGRFAERLLIHEREVEWVSRKEVKIYLCGDSRAKTPNITQSIRDIYTRAGLATGGGKDPVKGIKSNPGPLFGIAAHAWSALALIMAWQLKDT